MNGKNIKTILVAIHNNIDVIKKKMTEKQDNQKKKVSNLWISFPQTSGMSVKQDIILIIH